MRRFNTLLAAVVTAAVCLAACTQAAAAGGKKRRSKKIVFLSFKKGMKLQKKHNKPTMIHFTATWCGWCRPLHR